MQESDIESIREWLIERGLAGDSEKDLVQGFSARCEQAGLALATTAAVIETLHPIWEGRAFFWRKGGLEETPTLEYGSTWDGKKISEHWKNSVFHHLLETESDEFGLWAY